MANEYVISEKAFDPTGFCMDLRDNSGGLIVFKVFEGTERNAAFIYEYSVELQSHTKEFEILNYFMQSRAVGYR